MIEILLFATILLEIGALYLLFRGKQTDISSQLVPFAHNQEKFERTFRDELGKNREESGKVAQQNREELSAHLKSFNDSVLARMTDIAHLQSTNLATQAQSNEQKLEKMRETIEGKLRQIQDDNAKRLEQMRETVDEKLHATLEKRLGESFKQVSERLEQVHKGLGEMQTLALGVGDLKKVLTNIKTRGTWGEVQLGNLLEQVLLPEQYEKNAITKKGSNDRVEYAIKFPQDVRLPVDAKFPQEDYHRLVEAYEQANAEMIEESGKQLENRIKLEAKKIKEKYIDPPRTTDFAIMFLPYESLYAEVLRRPGLHETIQRDFRVTIAGPTTMGAVLNSLQMGFRTLAIQKRSSEVWATLGAVKTEFGRFGEMLEKTQKKLQEASNTIEDAAKKSRTIEKKLGKVQELPEAEAKMLVDAAGGTLPLISED